MGDDVESALGGAPVGGEVAALAAIARRIGGLGVSGPDAAAMGRMWARFEERTRRRRGAVAWLLGWLGLGLERRPLVQRLAAGAMLLAATAGGAQAAGLDVAGAARVAGEFVVNAARNLDPGRGVGGDSPFAEGTRTPAGSPTPGVRPTAADPTPEAGAQAEPTAAATPSPGQAGSGAPPQAGTPPVTPSPAATPTAQPTVTPTPSGEHDDGHDDEDDHEHDDQDEGEDNDRDDDKDDDKEKRSEEGD